MASEIWQWLLLVCNSASFHKLHACMLSAVYIALGVRHCLVEANKQTKICGVQTYQFPAYQVLHPINKACGGVTAAILHILQLVRVKPHHFWVLPEAAQI